MSQASKLLVITSEGYTSNPEHNKFIARAETTASKVGVELLVLEPGQNAFMLDGLTTPGKAAAGGIKSRLSHCLESRESYQGHALRGHVEPPKAIEGMALGVSLDPLESAIMSTAGLLAGATGQAAQRLDKHLAQLLDIQLNRVAAHE